MLTYLAGCIFIMHKVIIHFSSHLSFRTILMYFEQKVSSKCTRKKVDIKVSSATLARFRIFPRDKQLKIYYFITPLNKSLILKPTLESTVTIDHFLIIDLSFCIVSFTRYFQFFILSFLAPGSRIFGFVRYLQREVRTMYDFQCSATRTWGVCFFCSVIDDQMPRENERGSRFRTNS